MVIGAGLFAAFPDAYAVFLSAFYFPVLLMLFGLIFRGIAFEFRYRSERMRPIWDLGFFLGSVVVGFAQGAAVGAMIRGIPVANGQYAGGPFGWLHPFAILTGIGLVSGYALLGGRLARAEERGRVARLGASSHPLAHRHRVWRPVCGLCRYLRLQRSGAQQFARQALGPRIPRHRAAGVGWDPVGSAQGPRSTAVRHDVPVFPRRLHEPGA